MKNLVAAGDSFIYGTELADQTTGRYSRSTFTALLAQQLNTTYTCIAHPGSANNSITRRVMNYCETHADIDNRVAVMWTFPNRYEYRFAHATGHSPDRWESLTPWLLANQREIKRQMINEDRDTLTAQLELNRSLTKSGTKAFATEFWKTVAEAEYWETYTTLREVITLQNYLKVKHIPYLFMFADSGVLTNYTVAHADESIYALVNQLDRKRIEHFPGNKGFYTWALDNKYPVGATHPLEEAHREAAEVLKGAFYELVSQNL